MTRSDIAAATRAQRAPAEAGDTDAMFNLGALLEDSDPAQARQWYERAAEAGDTDSMNNLGALLEDSDPAQARQWYERAAEAGDTGTEDTRHITRIRVPRPPLPRP